MMTEDITQLGPQSAKPNARIRELERKIRERLYLPESLEERLRWETLLSNLSATFINLPSDEVDKEIGHGLQQIAEFLGVELSSVQQFSEDNTCLHTTHTYSAPGFKPLTTATRIEQIPLFARQLLHGKTVTVSRLDDLPDEVSPDKTSPDEISIDKQFAINLGIKSLLMIPLTVGDKILGAVSLYSIHNEQSWSNDLLRRLQFLGRIFASALLRRDTDQALSKREERYKQLLDAIPDAIVVIRRDGTITFINTQSEHLFGYTRDDLIGKPIESLMPDQFRGKHITHREKYFSDPYLRPMGQQLQLNGMRQDGSEFPVDISLSPIDAEHICASIRDVTHQRHRTTEQIEARQFSESVLNSLTAHIAVIDRNADIIAVNDAWQRFAQENGMGETDRLSVGNNYVEACRQALGELGSDAQAALAGIKAVLSGAEDCFELEYPCSSATEVRYFLMSVVPLRGERGGAIVTHSNITRRKEAELVLQESEQRFRMMADTAPVFIWMSGPDKGCTFFNQRWLEFTGRGLEQESGDGWAQGVHPDDIDRCLNVYTDAFDRRDDFTMEYRLRRHDGEYRWIVDTGTPCYTPDGVFTGYIGSCIDITDRKLAEQALKEEKRFSHGIIDSLPGLFFMLDRRGRYIRWNKNNETLTGCSADELRYRAAVDFVSPEDRDRIRQAIETGFRDGYVDVEYDNLTKDGKRIAYAGYGVRTTLGGRDYLIGVELDISERKQAEEESRLLREELAHVNRLATMGELSAALAHELNQPLTAILSNAQAAQRFLGHESPDLDELRAALADIVEADRRASGVIQRLRALLTKGKPECSQQDINEIVREVVELVRSDAVGRKIILSLKLEDNLPMVKVDRIQLQQVLLNLIINGFDAMLEVDGRRELQLQTSRDSAEVVNISVIDSGAGLEQEKMRHMFDAFFTTKPTGMGMGLSICRSIIDAHGGRLWASTNSERGMTLHIQLPVAEVIEP